uniref:Uncharacterized protein TCIL3000_11_3780 n=1 Tax=Trypanosoma congolense (strain IL3000) TaxID=1068625 RepID=G0V009_TRYCI|nr:unnamed protein product [Trypanosoma congolense IL3000]
MVSTLRRRVYFTHPPHFLLNVEGMEDGAVLRSAKQGGLQGTDEKQLPPPGSCLGSKELRQSTVRQSEMVTVAATTSSRIGAKELRHQLRDVPGFVTCWWLHSQHFRLLFVSKTALFKAKQLLDQFEVDGNVRVTITLPDGTSKEFVNHLAADEGGIL